VIELIGQSSIASTCSRQSVWQLNIEFQNVSDVNLTVGHPENSLTALASTTQPKPWQMMHTTGRHVRFSQPKALLRA
jgi:hypothetical protein